MQRSGGNVNRQLHSSKKFNNPCIYEHLIAHSGINETGMVNNCAAK
jgi:hypothetical protein